MPPSPLDPPRVEFETLPIERADGTPVTWEQMLAEMADADVIVLGEQHDDAVGHQVQLQIARYAMEQWPGTAVAMEMLDRSEQAAVDDYLAGYIDRTRFVERTASTRWRTISTSYLEGSMDRKTFTEKITRLGWFDWLGYYQPVIDSAKDAGSPVVAANTPWLLYTSVARREGFERLETLTPAQRQLYEVPESMPSGRYRERFWEAVAGRAEGEAPPETDDDGDEHAHGMSLTDEDVLGMFRGQVLMDATMAASIADALQAGAPKVVHLVGHFHCDYDGGLLQELRYRAPGARVLVISMPGPDDEDDGPGRADFVIDTGVAEG